MGPGACEKPGEGLTQPACGLGPWHPKWETLTALSPSRHRPGHRCDVRLGCESRAAENNSECFCEWLTSFSLRNWNVSVYNDDSHAGSLLQSLEGNEEG